MLASGNIVLLRSLSHGYASSFWLRDGDEHDLSLVRELRDHPDEVIAANAVTALWRAGREDLQAFLPQLLAVSVGGRAGVARELCRAFDAKHGIPLNAVSDRELDALIGHLTDIPLLDGYDERRFLGQAMRRRPRAIVSCLIQRIKNSVDHADGFRYRALPVGREDIDFGPLRELPPYAALLRQVRDRMEDAEPTERQGLARLFSMMAEVGDDTWRATVEEWIRSEEPARISVGADLLCSAPHDMVLSHPDFVARTLEGVQASNRQALERMIEQMLASAMAGQRSGTPGEPCPRDVDMLDGARKLAGGFRRGSVAHRFYARLAESCQREIDRWLERDREMFDI